MIVSSGRQASDSRILRVALVFCASAGVVAVSGSVALSAVSLFLAGLAALVLVVQLNVTLQLRVDEAYRGRVMALYVVCMYGTRPIGAPLVGWIGSAVSPRIAFALGPVLVMSVGLPAWRLLTRAP